MNDSITYKQLLDIVFDIILVLDTIYIIYDGFSRKRG